MDRNKLTFSLALLLAASTFAIPWAAAQEAAVDSPADPNPPTSEAAPANTNQEAGAPAAAEQKPDANAVAAANAAFQTKFNEYKAALREIEKLRAQYQAADAATRKKLNEQLTGQVANAQSIVNAMVDAAVEVYRLAPNADKQITDVLIDVARYYTIGRQTGPGESAPGNPDDRFYPIDGGDQYERALPIVKLLIDNGADNKQLLVWGFLAAYMTNDYDLAKQYLVKAGESGSLEELGTAAGKSDQENPNAGLTQLVAHLVSASASVLDEYTGLWAKESAIRAAEAKADDLPRVKLTTTKGEITIELFENEAPQSAANFLTLVKQGFYNGSPFHRVLPEFMAQGGAKDDEGQGGPGYTIRCECYRPDYRRHFRGTLSMAHAGRDTGNSQFFLTFVPTAHLNGRHTAFGRVIEGMEVLGDLQRRSTQHQQNPPPADKILKAEVIRDRDHDYKFDKLPDR